MPVDVDAEIQASFNSGLDRGDAAEVAETGGAEVRSGTTAPSVSFDALEFPNGQVLKLRQLVAGQTATVLESYPCERQCDNFIKGCIDGRAPYRQGDRRCDGRHDSAAAWAAHDQCSRSVDLLAPF
jgi:hypothetical protein